MNELLLFGFQPFEVMVLSVSCFYLAAYTNAVFASMMVADFFDPSFLHIIANNILVGIIASFVFFVFYHVTTKNAVISRRDLFFMLSGPSLGMLLSVLGLPQTEIVMWTFTMNLGTAGIKDFLAKMAERLTPEGG